MRWNPLSAAMLGLLVTGSILAEEKTEELPTLTVESAPLEPGTAALQPGLSATLDAAELLKEIPGGGVNRNGPLTGIAYFRGLYGERVHVLTDGTPLRMAGPNAMDTPLSYVPITLTETLKVYRGVTPVSAGIETIGGAIITRTRRPDFSEAPLKPTLFATGGYSSVNDGYYLATLIGLAGPWYRFHFSGTRERGDDYRYNDRENLVPTDFDRDSSQVGAAFRMRGHLLELTYDKKHTGSTGTPALPMDIRYIDGDIIRLNHRWDISERDHLKSQLWYQNSRHLMTNYHMRKHLTGLEAAQWRKMRTSVQAGGWKAAFMFNGIGPGELELGFDGDVGLHHGKVRNPNDPNFFLTAYNDVWRNRYSAYLEWRGELFDRFHVTAGVRYRHTYLSADRVDASLAYAGPMSALWRTLRDFFNRRDRNRHFNNVDLALNLRYEATDFLDLTLGLARKTQAPTYQQLFNWAPTEATGGLADGMVYLGNLDLDDEKAYEVVTGFDLHFDELAGGLFRELYFEPRAFYRYVRDYIQGGPLPPDLEVRNAAARIGGRIASCPQAPQRGERCVLQWQNINAQLFGVDVRTGAQITDHFRLDGTLTYTRGKKVSGRDDNLYRIQPLTGRLRGTFFYHGFSFSAEVVGALRQDHTARFNFEPSTSDWSVVNLRLQYQPSSPYLRGLTVVVGIDNIADNRHTNHLNGILRVRGKGLSPGQRVFDPGRNVYATVSYQF